MPTAKKAAVIEELTEKLGQMNAAALIDYRGLTVAEIGDLRAQLRQRNVELQVTKNTLLREAAHRNNITDLDELFNGPTAVAFIYQDESAATKALNTYFRTARVGEIKSGILKGGRGVSAAQFAKLADLPNRETLLAQIAGLLESPMAQLAALFNAPMQQFAYALAALEDKGGAAGAGVSTAPAPPVTPVSDVVEAPSAEPAQAESQPEIGGEIGVAETEPGAVDVEAPVPGEAAPAIEAETPATIVAAVPAIVEAETPAAAEADTAAAMEPETPATAEAAAPEETAETAGSMSVDAETAAGEVETPAAVEAGTPATVEAADATSAPESEGGAAMQAAEPVTADVEPAQEAAENTSSAPESEGSADARP